VDATAFSSERVRRSGYTRTTTKNPVARSPNKLYEKGKILFDTTTNLACEKCPPGRDKPTRWGLGSSLSS
jgi:hypothetical protein